MPGGIAVLISPVASHYFNEALGNKLEVGPMPICFTAINTYPHEDYVTVANNIQMYCSETAAQKRVYVLHG